ncbi:MAG: hypothetical protein AB1603_06260 [Chloroflexota bacterium]
MGQRAYLVITCKEGTAREQFVNIVRELEATPGVDYVDPVKGLGNLVIMLDAPVSVEETAEAIKGKPWVKRMELLKILGAREQQSVFAKVRKAESAR